MARLWFLALLALPATRQESEPVVIAKDALQPHLAADPDGAFYCAFLRNGNIEVATSSDGGKTWSAPAVAIDAKGKARGGMQRGPRIGVDDRKRVTVTAPVCFDPKELKAPSPKSDLWIARSTDGGRTFGPPARVNEKPGTAAEALHALAVAPSGEAHVAWLDARGRAKGQDLYYAKIAEGKPGPNVKVGDTVCECCAPGLALDGTGNPTLAWRDGGPTDSRPLWFVTSKDGGKSFTPPLQVNQTPTRVAGCPMDAPAVAVSRDGRRFAFAWMDQRLDGASRQVYCSVSKPGFDGKERPLADMSKGAQGHPAIAYDAKGFLHAAWEDVRLGVQRIRYRSPDGTDREVALSPEKRKASFPALACGKVVGVAFELESDAVFTAVR